MPREIWSGNWDRMSFEEQREYRDRKFSYYVRTQLYPFSPYYRRLFDEHGIDPNRVRRLEDIRSLPFTYKADIAPDQEDPERFRQFILQPDRGLMESHLPRGPLARLRLQELLKGKSPATNEFTRRFRPVHMQFTTGRTGRPTPILYGGQDVARMAEAGRRVLELCGFGSTIDIEGASVINAMPFAPHLAFWMVTKGLERAGILGLDSGGGRVLGTSRIVGAVESMGATGIIGMPGYVYHLLKAAAEEGRDLSSVRVLLLAAERVSGGTKEKMRELLAEVGSEAYVLGALGFTEGRKAYAECAPGGETGYHLYPDMDYIELVDPASGEPVAEGEDGELVYTCLEGQGTAVLRFRTGDLVRGGLVHERCPSCGRTVPRLSSDIVRTGSVKGFCLMKLKGTLVDQGSFWTALDGVSGVAEWQVEIDKAGGDPYEVDIVNVYVSAEPDLSLEARRRLVAEVEGRLELQTEVKPNRVELVELDELVERLRADDCMKELRFVDRRPEL